jgi:hypothetical protein
MSIEHPPHEEQARREAFQIVERAGNVVSLRENNDIRQANDAPHQGGEKLAVLMRRVICLADVVVFTQRHHVAGAFDNLKCFAAGLLFMRRMFDTHDTFLMWPGRRFSAELSLESTANLRRKRIDDEARQKGHTFLQSHGGSD